MTHTMQPTPMTMVFGGQPAAADLDSERRERKHRLAAALRVFARLRFDIGVAGHITVRDPGDPDLFWVNPFGVAFAHIHPGDLLLVDHGGRVIEGGGVLNTAAFRIHAHVHAARPDVVAAAHAHSLYSSAWSAMGRLVEPLTNEGCFFFEDHVVHAEHTGITVEDDKARAIAADLGPHRAAFLVNHGALTVGGTVDEAAWWFVALEHACHVQFLAEAAGPLRPVNPVDARLVRDTMGTAHAGWFSFQPLYQQAVRDNPDLTEPS
jgi:ribulose-5-phosphate 4-epimerase/fuculose-1-phosphate aldolase